MLGAPLAESCASAALAPISRRGTSGQPLPEPSGLLEPRLGTPALDAGDSIAAGPRLIASRSSFEPKAKACMDVLPAWIVTGPGPILSMDAGRWSGKRLPEPECGELPRHDLLSAMSLLGTGLSNRRPSKYTDAPKPSPLSLVVILGTRLPGERCCDRATPAGRDNVGATLSLVSLLGSGVSSRRSSEHKDAPRPSPLSLLVILGTGLSEESPYNNEAPYTFGTGSGSVCGSFAATGGDADPIRGDIGDEAAPPGGDSVAAARVSSDAPADGAGGSALCAGGAAAATGFCSCRSACSVVGVRACISTCRAVRIINSLVPLDELNAASVASDLLLPRDASRVVFASLLGDGLAAV